VHADGLEEAQHGSKATARSNDEPRLLVRLRNRDVTRRETVRTHALAHPELVCHAPVCNVTSTPAYACGGAYCSGDELVFGAMRCAVLFQQVMAGGGFCGRQRLTHKVITIRRVVYALHMQLCSAVHSASQRSAS
jgi:hypothetical protein